MISFAAILLFASFCSAGKEDEITDNDQPTLQKVEENFVITWWKDAQFNSKITNEFWWMLLMVFDAGFSLLLPGWWVVIVNGIIVLFSLLLLLFLPEAKGDAGKVFRAWLCMTILLTGMIAGIIASLLLFTEYRGVLENEVPQPELQELELQQLQ